MQKFAFNLVVYKNVHYTFAPPIYRVAVVLPTRYPCPNNTYDVIVDNFKYEF